MGEPDSENSDSDDDDSAGKYDRYIDRLLDLLSFF
ncbi:hypothetical protein HALLA_13210 [Halostagnicola larsenii XH-48]|uniref:Uncharacterized protein n=1 Tax=Halostagnicola larsenii XH-48 TaxID=797299 RepID=W0JUK6_9EURY|nr:hypothetical protein HALLA_13210 [Halostagnicola larsenii XH-48]